MSKDLKLSFRVWIIQLPTLQNSLIYDTCIVVKSSGKTQVKNNLWKIIKSIKWKSKITGPF